jgi:hypothetical protein
MQIISYKKLNNQIEIEYLVNGQRLIYKTVETVRNSKFSNLIKEL